MPKRPTTLSIADSERRETELNPNHLFIDQYGEPVWARTAKELREKCGGGKVSILYTDKKDGRTVNIGYVVGRRWFTRFAPVERPVDEEN